MSSSSLLLTHFLLAAPKERRSPLLRQPHPRANARLRTTVSCSSTRRWKWACGSSPQEPPPHKQKQRPCSQRRAAPASESDANVDPVGFLSKLGITNKAFAQFLRDRHKALKDRKVEICARFLDLMQAASGYEILGIHRNRKHRVDFMEWAPGGFETRC